MRLFLYGTLQPAADTAMARWLAPKIVAAVPATVTGRLLAVPAEQGWYPALVPGHAGGRCRGTLVRADLDAHDLAELDRYEGSEYRRCSIEAATGDGSPVTATTYVWSAAVPQAALPIPDGDFLDWLRRNRRRAFGTRDGD